MDPAAAAAAWRSEAGIAQLRAAEFARLGDAVYVDHAGATLHSETQLAEAVAQLNGGLLGNPHSQNESSTRAGEHVRRAREAVLRHCNTSAQSYDVVFTANATAALRLVGESFPWSAQSEFAYTVQNHNSVLGIREYAAERGAAFSALDYGELLARAEAEAEAEGKPALRAGGGRPPEDDPAEADGVHSLFAFPGECNFSGQKLDLGLIELFQRGRGGRAPSAGQWCVFLDAAKLAATSPLDLSAHPADFACISFYKMFGYPTGIGALLVRRDRAALLKRTYFGGGTVGAAISTERYHVLREDTAGRFEDGTVSFLSIAALPVGLAQLRRLGMHAISEHTHSLAVRTHGAMAALRHAGGQRVAEFYGFDADPAKHGSVLNFNLLRPDGGFVGFREVEKLASIHGIHLRTGGFCNPGATQSFLRLTHEQVKQHVELGHVCWDDHDLIDGVPTGSVRVSFGYMSSTGDTERLVSFVAKYFVVDATADVLPSIAVPAADERPAGSTALATISQLRVYPIKSCAGMGVSSWPIGPNGLLFDREWVVVDSSGMALSLKNEARLTLIKPSVDISRGLLTVQLDDSEEQVSLPPLVISLEQVPGSENSRSMQVCGDTCTGRVYEGDASEWFTTALRRECRLARRPPGQAERSQQQLEARESGGEGLPPSIAFANEGQLLIVGEESIGDLQRRLPESCDMKLELTARFRPNIVISGAPAFEEDHWTTLRTASGSASGCAPPLLLRAFKPCNRCGIVNVDTGTAKRHREPFLTLAQYRRTQGKVLFGTLYNIEGEAANASSEHRYVLSVGAELETTRD